MAVYPLARLVGLREHRRDDARSRQQAAHQAVLQAADEVKKRERELEEYKVWREEEIERRYAAIKEQVLEQQELEEFKAGLAQLNARDAILAEAIAQAEHELDKAKEEEEKTHVALLKCTKALGKLEEHRKQWLHSQAVLEEQQADLELEDFHGKALTDV